MSLSAAENESGEIHLPAEVDWHMLDKSKFFILGAALFSGVTATLYPAVVLKTRQQVTFTQAPCWKVAFQMLRHEGFRAFYRGFGTSLMGTIPARTLYMTTLEITKTNVGSSAIRVGFSEPTATTIANAAAGLSASMAAQLVWTPVDVVSQRLMVQGSSSNNKIVGGGGGSSSSICCSRYVNGVDAFKKILYSDGIRGLYRGFGISILTYAPSSAAWWGSYSVAHRIIGSGVGLYGYKNINDQGFGGNVRPPSSTTMVGVQAASAAIASGVSALVTMPFDTIKTRLQVLDGSEENGCGRRPPTVVGTVKDLLKEGGFSACYRGLGPRWVSMSMSAATMVTTYELVKRLSTKHDHQRTTTCFH